jgi:hypothetical protein
MPEIPWHVTGADEITRHDDPNVKCASPVVIVPSEYVPSALAVNPPVTASVPVIGAEQPGAPTGDRSSVSLNARQDDATCHVPKTSPPQGDTFAQAAPPLPPAASKVLSSDEQAKKNRPRLVAQTRAAARVDEVVTTRANKSGMTSTVDAPAPLQRNRSQRLSRTDAPSHGTRATSSICAGNGHSWSAGIARSDGSTEVAW